MCVQEYKASPHHRDRVVSHSERVDDRQEEHVVSSDSEGEPRPLAASFNSFQNFT